MLFYKNLYLQSSATGILKNKSDRNVLTQNDIPYQVGAEYRSIFHTKLHYTKNMVNMIQTWLFNIEHRINMEYNVRTAIIFEF